MCAANNQVDAIDVAKPLARQLFARRGDHSEVHLSEAEVAALIALGIERAQEEAGEKRSSALAHAEAAALERSRRGGQHALHVLSFGDAKAQRLRSEAERAEQIVIRMAKLVEYDNEGNVDETPAFRELEKQLRMCGEAPGKIGL